MYKYISFTNTEDSLISKRINKLREEGWWIISHSSSIEPDNEVVSFVFERVFQPDKEG